MKQRYSICIFVVLVIAVCSLFAVAGSYHGKDSEEEQTDTQEKKEEDTQENAVYSGKEQESYAYIIFEEDGHLLVYYSDNTTVFFDTGILSKNLSEKMREQLVYGIRFANEDELYEFLENYSS